MSAPWATFVEISVSCFQLFFLGFLLYSPNMTGLNEFSGLRRSAVFQGFIFSFSFFFLKISMYIWFASPSRWLTILDRCLFSDLNESWCKNDLEVFVVLILWLWLGFLSYYMHFQRYYQHSPRQNQFYDIHSELPPITHCVVWQRS